MKTIMPDIKYIESKSPVELHIESLNWISELKFIKDEQHFLDELLKSYTLQLIEKQDFSKNKDIISHLSNLRKDGEKLLKKIINHENELLILVDGIDQIKEEKHYRFLHSTYIMKVTNYFNEYKDAKRDIFDVVKKIMKQEKQKRLLN